MIVDYVQNEQKVEPGEWFYTSGDDRIFPKGLPVGEATVVRAGKSYKEIFVTPSGLQNGLEEVLIVIEGVHAPIPEAPADFATGPSAGRRRPRSRRILRPTDAAPTRTRAAIGAKRAFDHRRRPPGRPIPQDRRS